MAILINNVATRQEKWTKGWMCFLFVLNCHISRNFDNIIKIWYFSYPWILVPHHCCDNHFIGFQLGHGRVHASMTIILIPSKIKIKMKFFTVIIIMEVIHFHFHFRFQISSIGHPWNKELTGLDANSILSRGPCTRKGFFFIIILLFLQGRWCGGWVIHRDRILMNRVQRAMVFNMKQNHARNLLSPEHFMEYSAAKNGG